PLGAALVDLARWPDVDENDIAGGGVAHGLGGNEDLDELVPLVGIGADEAEAGVGPAKDAGERAVGADGPDGVALADLDASLADQLLEGRLEGVVLRRWHFELASEGFRF